MELEVEITRLGAQGDAVAERPDGPIFVPFTLPGERVRVAVDPKSDHATLLDVLEQSAERVTARISACAAAARSSTWR
jgi:23S rRNA (uracil1939-C5)-methyltransferase